MIAASDSPPTDERIIVALRNFVGWLESYGETSWDHQSFFAGTVGQKAKALYYKNKLLGTAAVAPMIFCEAFLPDARRLFHHPIRLPIADAHYAMGFAYLYQATKEEKYLDGAIHFLEVLEKTRCSNFKNYAWGYPFDWQTQGGVLATDTPLITTVPYCYEAFDAVYRIDDSPKWRQIMLSIAEHALHDYADEETSRGTASCTYTPQGGKYVINASAYRAALLLQAYKTFGNESYREVAWRNIAFVLDSQNDDGSWPYAMDGSRGFIDHFHTCFVLKGLVKAERIIRDKTITSAIERGIDYYTKQLFDEDGLPKPFSRRPRLTVYRRELYDCAECLNLGVMLRGRFPHLDRVVNRTLDDILRNWVRPTGSFRSRKLLFGWDNVPMHRWGQSEMFRSLAYWLAQSSTFEVSVNNSFAGASGQSAGRLPLQVI